MFKDHSIVNDILWNKQTGKDIRSWKILYLAKLFPPCSPNLSQVFKIEISCAHIHYTPYLNDDHDNDNNNPTIIYIILFKRISNQLFHLLLSNIAKPTWEAVVALFILKHREAKWFASGSSVAGHLNLNFKDAFPPIVLAPATQL